MIRLTPCRDRRVQLIQQIQQIALDRWVRLRVRARDVNDRTSREHAFSSVAASQSPNPS